MNDCSLPGCRFIRKNDKRRHSSSSTELAQTTPIRDALPLDGITHTSNRAELRAVIVALSLRVWPGEGFDNIILATDSEYLVLGISERIHKWMQNGWKTSSGGPVKNRDLWEAILEKLRDLESQGCHIQFWLIPRAWNEADKYAKEAAWLWVGHTESTSLTTKDSIHGRPVCLAERLFSRVATDQTRPVSLRTTATNSAMAKVELSPQAKRLKTIIVSLPILVAASVVYYKREVLGEPQRTIPRPQPNAPASSKTTLLSESDEKPL
ncbi:hypothetical protein NMY22_g17833 [Coprinellus aureogranulatus]|nr:hypothetical protein NMY22_g17833 [Coprinellus aureogranulatus]